MATALHHRTEPELEELGRDGRPARRYVGTGTLGEVPGGLQTGQNVGLELPFLEMRVDAEALKINRDT